MIYEMLCGLRVFAFIFIIAQFRKKSNEFANTFERLGIYRGMRAMMRMGASVQSVAFMGRAMA